MADNITFKLTLDGKEFLATANLGEDALRKITKTTKDANVSFNEMASKWGNIVTGINQVTDSVRQFGQSMNVLIGQNIKQAAAFNELRETFRGTEQDIRNFQLATKETVSQGDLIKMSNQMSDLGVSLEQQTILFALAEQAADAYGTTVPEGMSKVLQASNGSERALAKLGISVVTYKNNLNDLVAATGRRLDKMSVEQQETVKLEALMRSTNMTVQQAVSGMKSENDQLEAMKIKYEEAKIELGNFLLQGLRPLIKAYDESGKGTQSAITAIGVLGETAINSIPMIAQLLTSHRLLQAASLTTAANTNVATAAVSRFNIASAASKFGVMAAGLAVVVGIIQDRLNDIEKSYNQTQSKIMVTKKESIFDLASGKNIEVEKKYWKDLATGELTEYIEEGVKEIGKQKESWSDAGKTVGEINDRIAYLLEEKQKTVLNSKEMLALDIEIQRLQKLMSKSKTGVSVKPETEQSVMPESLALAEIDKQEYDRARSLEKFKTDLRKEENDRRLALDQEAADRKYEIEMQRREQEDQAFEEMHQRAIQISNYLADGFSSGIIRGLDTGKLSFNDFLKDIRNMIIQAGIRQLFMQLFSAPAGGGGGFLGGIGKLFGYAKGGIIEKPEIILAGEREPEIIAPVPDFNQFVKDIVRAAASVSNVSNYNRTANTVNQLLRDPVSFNAPRVSSSYYSSVVNRNDNSQIIREMQLLRMEFKEKKLEANFQADLRTDELIRLQTLENYVAENNRI